MGDEVAAKVFTGEDRKRYREKVKRCLDVFARMLAESRFDADRRSIGLEIELNITEETGDPAMANQHVLEMIADPDWQTELAQFNIEINIPPRTLGRRRAERARGDRAAPASTTPRRARRGRTRGC